MGKRKKQAFIYTACTLLLLAYAAVFVLKSDIRFRIKHPPYTAVEIEITTDSSLITKDFVSNAALYCKNNNINTAILKINTGNSSIIPLDGLTNIFSGNPDFAKNDIAAQLKNILARKRIQLYLAVDCLQLEYDTVISLINQLCENYSVAGIVLDNFARDIVVLDKITAICHNADTELLLQADAGTVYKYKDTDTDGFICENMDYRQYSDIKSAGEISQKILLHHTSPSLYSDMYLLANFSQLDGAVVTNYTGGQADSLLIATTIGKNTALPLFNMSIKNEFTVTYPTKDITTYYSGIFITGTAQPGTVNVNGIEYATAKDGSFGIYFELEKGDNHFTVSQGDRSEEFTATRKVYKSGTVKYEATWDETEYLEKGRIIQTADALTSILSDPDDDSAIIAGIEQGTKLKVTASVETKRDGYKTYAYQLSNGGYVLASEVEILPEIASDFIPDNETEFDFTSFSQFETPVITAAQLEKMENSDEQLYITVNNTPAVITEFSSEKLTLLFMDTQAKDIKLPQSAFYKSGIINQYGTGTEITLFFDQAMPLWGYDVKADTGQFVIYLKHAPKLTSGDKPLQGITVMLDAGHGGKDSGALGVASVNGPLEKQLNLAVAQATKAVLQQYGAQVIMTRDDDSYLTLDERRSLIRQYKPDLFIAVHHNSMDYSYNSTKSGGVECYYFTHQSEKLAQLMCDSISVATDRQNRGAYAGHFFVTRTDITPSVLMEYGFMINPQEFSTLYTDTDIYKAAFGTLQAVLKAIPE